MSIELTGNDKGILWACPFDLEVVTRPLRAMEANLARLRAVTRLQRAGLVSVRVVSRTTLHVELRDPGRIAIGLPPRHTEVAPASC